jgi:protein-S-isoprenylcysteine O-methyltransferase Ste14
MNNAIIGAMDTLTAPTLLATSFWVTLACWMAIGLWEGQGRRAKQTTREGRRNDLLCFYGVGIAGLMAILCKGLFPNTELYHYLALCWISIVLIWAGTLLRHWAIATLGEYHVMTIHTEPTQPVIMKGPYRYIRHPSYAGALMTIFGIAVALNSLPGSIILVTVAATVLIERIRIEDAYLTTHLGATYKNYAEHTYRLIPFMW